MENALRSVADTFADSWTEAVPWVLYAYREVPVEPSNFSPFELCSDDARESPKSDQGSLDFAWGINIREERCY